MALKINNYCLLCGACEPECPTHAIYEDGTPWSMAGGTRLKGPITLLDGTVIDAHALQPPLSHSVFYIVAGKCTECQGFHEEPQCASVCPVDCCVPDEMYRETVDELLAKKEKMHI